jgi:hypothetical protein
MLEQSIAVHLGEGTVCQIPMHCIWVFLIILFLIVLIVVSVVEISILKMIRMCRFDCLLL